MPPKRKGAAAKGGRGRPKKATKSATDSSAVDETKVADERHDDGRSNGDTEEKDTVRAVKMADTEQKSAADDKADTANNGGDTAAHTTSGESRVLEKGDLIFLYRPRVGLESAASLDDVQKFYLLMIPDAKYAHAKDRLFIVGAKMLPASGSGRHQTFMFVNHAATDIDDLSGFLDEFKYDTKTRGERTVKGVRVVGKAKYDLIDSSSEHTHLVYVLEEPHEPEEPQKMFNIVKEGSYLVSVRNPHAVESRTGFSGIQPSKKPEYPSHLQETFRGKIKPEKQFTKLVPEMLNYDGCEVHIISVSHKRPMDEFAEILSELEEEAEKEAQRIDKETHDKPEQAILKEAHLDPQTHPSALHEMQ